LIIFIIFLIFIKFLFLIFAKLLENIKNVYYLKKAKKIKKFPVYSPCFKIKKVDWKEITLPPLVLQHSLKVEIENSTSYPLCEIELQIKIYTREDVFSEAKKFKLLLPNDKMCVKKTEEVCSSERADKVVIVLRDVELNNCIFYQEVVTGKETIEVKNYLDYLKSQGRVSENEIERKCKEIAKEIKNLPGYSLKVSLDIEFLEIEEWKTNVYLDREEIKYIKKITGAIFNYSAYPISNLVLFLDNERGSSIVIAKIPLLLPGEKETLNRKLYTTEFPERETIKVKLMDTDLKLVLKEVTIEKLKMKRFSYPPPW